MSRIPIKLVKLGVAIGKIEDNGFVKQVQKETKDFEKLVKEIKCRI